MKQMTDSQEHRKGFSDWDICDYGLEETFC